MDDGRLVELMRRSASGEQDAFAELYDLTAARVHGVVLKVVKSVDLAADISQEVFVEVWRNCPRYRSDRGSVLAWILTIAHRRAVDRVRATASASNREERYARSDPDPQPVDEVWDEARRNWEADRVRSALEQLSPAQREALTLAYFDGYSQSQVADRLNIPLGTVKTRMRDGLTHLHHQMEVQS
jgi:RNA polymerase sigma-70 factor (ECF subfamily)